MPSSLSPCHAESLYPANLPLFVQQVSPTEPCWMISLLFYAYVYEIALELRDGSLITCGEGMKDILIYLMEFSSPLSDLCKYFDPHSRISEQTPES